MNRKLTTFHYCACCRMTTAHDETPHNSRCLRCGAVKCAIALKAADAQTPSQNAKGEMDTSHELRWN